ncbi:MAG: NAD-dependent epimerase/dehydratase family protein, partial [Thermoplasmata archaeon]
MDPDATPGAPGPGRKDRTKNRSGGSPSERPRLLLVGGAGGFVGRALLRELGSEYAIRSVHRRVAPVESGRVEWVAADATGPVDWARALAGVRVVVNLAWFRWESPERFRALHDGLRRLLAAAERARVERFLQVSVPPATPEMERTLPYLLYKR